MYARGTIVDELHERESHWERLLERAEGMVAGDPFSALDGAHEVAGEIAQYRSERPEAHGSLALAMLEQHTHSVIDVTALARQRMVDETAEREQRRRERELHAVATPMGELRRPWPAGHVGI
jgi:hypothetical protein